MAPDDEASTIDLSLKCGGAAFGGGGDSARPCYGYQKGDCRFGDSCRFSHEGAIGVISGGGFGGGGGRGGRGGGRGGFDGGMAWQILHPTHLAPSSVGLYGIL